MPLKTRSLTALALLAAAAAGLSGCASTGAGHAEKPLRAAVPLPFDHFKIDVVEVPDQIALGVHPQGLSQRQAEALGDFVARWRDAGGGDVTVEQPGDATNAASARAMVFAVEGYLHAHGIPQGGVKLGAYDAGAPDAPILARFQKLTAKVPNCNDGWDNLVSTMSNEVYKHFGCSLAANMAVQVADPHDLVSPGGLAPADAARRQYVLDRYRQGRSSTAEKEKQADSAVSTAVAQ